MIAAPTIELAVPAGRGGCGCDQNPMPEPLDTVTCAVCGFESSFPLPAAPPGPADVTDLEGRPMGTRRNDFATWIQRCPGCGYCAREIYFVPWGLKEFIRTAAYQEKLRDPTLPHLAISFLSDAAVRIASMETAERGLGLALLHAAWSCDDAGQPLHARRCRSRAANQLIEALQHAGELDADPVADILLIVELLRRTRRFSEAQSFLTLARKQDLDDRSFRQLVLLQGLLCRKDWKPAPDNTTST